MKYLFHLGHPAHFHLFKNSIQQLKDDGHQVAILIKKKDILEELLQNAGLDYYNLLPNGRRDNKVGIALGMIETDIKLFRFALSFKPTIMVGTSYAISHVGKLLRIPSINVNEDDFDVVPLYSKLSYPWASTILAPCVCKTGKWEEKTIHYEGYHELAYLHPNHFVPEKAVVEKYFSADESYFIIRFAKLTAHHDKGIGGITSAIAEKIIEILKPHGRIFITSERPLEEQFEQYRIRINPLDIHHVMAFSSLYIGDSQTMAAEAGVLGIPFIRFNDFVGRIGYLRELETKYNLGFGIKTSEADRIYSVLNELVNTADLKHIWMERRKKMLQEKIDSAKFLTWFIENYPASNEIMQKTPEYQYKFQ